MPIKVISPNILIKVPKEEENNKREKIGDLFIHPSFVWMTRNTQNGIVVSISPEAKRQFPEVKENDILIVHHFVQNTYAAKENRNSFLVHEDSEFNYYSVTSKMHDGQNNQTYGLWNGIEIIPHKEYVFLEKETGENNIWDEPDYVHQKQQDIKNQIYSLTKTRLTPEIISEVHKLEAEQMKLSTKLQKNEYLPYKIAYCNPSLNLESGSTVFALNIAAQTEIDFMNKSYRVVEKKFIVAID